MALSLILAIKDGALLIPANKDVTNCALCQKDAPQSSIPPIRTASFLIPTNENGRHKPFPTNKPVRIINQPMRLPPQAVPNQ